jgi:hypothetical protein
MAEEAFVDVAYRGLEVGRRLRLREVGPRTGYVEVGTPMPVGAGLVLRTDEGVSIAAVVIRVHEQVAGADMPPGMRIRTEELDGAAAGWWQGLVSRGDPDIPEPEQAPVALAFEVAPQAHDTAVMKVAEVAEVAEPAAALPGESGNGESDADPHTLSASHTVVMSAVEISEITGLPVEDDDSGEADAAPDEADAGTSSGNGASGANGDELQGGRGRRRKRRRR